MLGTLPSISTVFRRKVWNLDEKNIFKKKIEKKITVGLDETVGWMRTSKQLFLASKRWEVWRHRLKNVMATFGIASPKWQRPLLHSCHYYGGDALVDVFDTKMWNRWNYTQRFEKETAQSCVVNKNSHKSEISWNEISYEDVKKKSHKAVSNKNSHKSENK